MARRTTSELPTYDDGRDTFVLSGQEDLVRLSDGEEPARYIPRVEGLFARILHHRGDRGDWWEVWSRDGTVSRYGTERPDGADSAWRDPATVTDPAFPTRIFSWHLFEHG